MKKISKILSVILTASLSISLAMPSSYAVGGRRRAMSNPTKPTSFFGTDVDPNECETPEPATLSFSMRHYSGMGTRWQNAIKSGKAAARYFKYSGPGSGYGNFGHYEYTDMGPTALIILDNEEARKELLLYYASKGLTQQIKILEDHPTENLFMIWVNDLKEISKTVTLFTGIGLYQTQTQTDNWAKGVCIQSHLKASPIPIDDVYNHQTKFSDLVCAAQRDLRQGSSSLGEANFAWGCEQHYMAKWELK